MCTRAHSLALPDNRIPNSKGRASPLTSVPAIELRIGRNETGRREAAVEGPVFWEGPGYRDSVE